MSSDVRFYGAEKNAQAKATVRSLDDVKDMIQNHDSTDATVDLAVLQVLQKQV